MAIRYAERDFVSFQEYIERQASHSLAATDGAPPYAHPMDGWIISTLESAPVKAVVTKAIDVAVSFSSGYNLATSMVLDAETFPEAFAALSHCARTLGIPIPHTVARQGALNAYTSGTDEYAFIHVSAFLLKAFPTEELTFVLGHECGHIAARHSVYHTVAHWLATITQGSAMAQIVGVLGFIAGLPLLTIPLNAWSRRSEVTADRAGLLCCGDLNVAAKALLRLVAFPMPLDDKKVESYLRNSWATQSYHRLGQVNELFTSHPAIPKRIEALKLFADSELYYLLSGKEAPPGKALLSREELNRRVGQIVRP